MIKNEQSLQADVFLSVNPNITWSIVRDNPDYQWDYAGLSNNKMSKHPFFSKQLSYVLK